MPARHKKVRFSRTIADFESEVNRWLETPDHDLSELCRQRDNLRLKISWLMHERLVHLLVTILFAIALLFVCGMLMIIVVSIPWLILLALIAVLLVAYILHYYKLENTVQRWYALYDDITKRIEDLHDKSQP